MAEPFSAGSAYATIKPQLAKNWRQDLKAQVEDPKNDPKATVKVQPKVGLSQQFQQELRARMAKISANVMVNPKLGPTTAFKTELRTAMSKISTTVKVDAKLGSTAELKRDLRTATANLPALKVGVDLDFTRARQQLAAFRAATPDLHLNVDLDTTAASAHMAALIAQAMALRGALNGIDIPGGGGLNGVARGASSIVGPASAAATALAALAAVNLVPLVGQLAQAAGVVSLIPAGAAAAAASLATVVIGGNGVMDAFKAAGEAAVSSGQAATSSAKQQRAAARQVEDAERAVADARENATWTAKDGARQIASAERQVQDAQKRSLDAQEDLTRARKDAQQQIEDLNFALKGSAIDEEDALIAVERARERLRDLGKDGQPVSALDVREAQNGVQSALRRVDEVRRRNSELQAETDAANRAGVEGAQQVVDAREAAQEAAQGEIDAVVNLSETRASVARNDAQAQRQVEDALRRVADAQEAQAEAMTASAGGVDKFAEAMANLSPNAQDFVTKVRAMGDEWRNLRIEIQDNLFAGLGSSIQDLGNNYFPILREGLGGIATEINGGLKRAIEDLNSESTKLDWSNVLNNTKDAIGPFMDGISSLAGALTNIASIGSDFLVGGAESFSETMQGFEDWTNSSEGRDRIRDFMEKSIDSLKQLKDLFIEVGRVIGGLFSTSEENGKSMIQSMTDNLREFADWMGTPEGQARMSQFWDDAQQTAEDMLRLVGEAIKLADKVSKIVDSKFGLTTGNQGLVDENGNAVNKDGERVIGRAGIFPGIKADSWLGRLLGGGDDGGESAPDAPEGGVPSVGGTPLDGANLQSALKDQIAAGNTEGGSFLGDLGDPEKWGEKWDSFSNTVASGWNEKVSPSLQGVKDKAAEIGKGFIDDVQTKAGNAWAGLKDGVSSGWTSIQGTWQTLRTEGLGGLANDFTSKITNGSVTSWKDLPGAISSGVGDIVDRQFPWLSNALGTLQGTFQNITGYIAGFFDGMGQSIAGVWEGVVRNVKNAVQRIGELLQKVPTKIGPITVPGGQGARELGDKLVGWAQANAAGGFITGPGTGTSDSILSWLSNGEYVVKASQVAKPGVRTILEALNDGWVPDLSYMRSMLPAFATGGYVGEAGDRALSFARSKAGLPYVYGGAGGDSWDCSGYMSGIHNALTGQSVRYVTGSDFAALGYEPGFDPNGFSIGTDGGVGTGGHMAGTLFGINVESDGSNGVQFGGGADGALDFPMVWHLPRHLWNPPSMDDPYSESIQGLDYGNDGASGLDYSGGGTTPAAPQFSTTPPPTTSYNGPSGTSTTTSNLPDAGKLSPAHDPQQVFRASADTFRGKLPGIAQQMISGWLPDGLLSPGGLVGGLMSAGQELFNWYRNQAAGGTNVAGGGVGGFDPGSVISGFLGGTGPQPIPAPYKAAPLSAVDQFVRNAPAPAAAGVSAGGDTYQFHVTNIDEAFRKYQQMQSRKAAGFMSR
ncbi:hypothetical protein [Rhodococcus sp. 2G]|uniref:hypothetical protein n=1 Tax=Rhodococcus sp. 2G TaxID=1570939 RepID=UPI000B055B49|nr:hypothetical protein [Rhodococcus sp. 2G]